MIVGAGHAGLEAIHAAAQFGLKVAVVTMPGVGIASAPCNPAIGGVGKGQVVREIDMLGGVMGKLADIAGIQYRILNESKGYAVQSTRVQIDKDMYSKAAEELLNSLDNVTVIYAEVENISRDGDFKIKCKGSNDLLATKKIIITTGTFLGGKLHAGEVQVSGGRKEAKAANSLSDLFSEVKTLSLRFKTGTPPRLSKKSINFDKLIRQKSDQRTRNFHFLNNAFSRECEQVSCFLTHTNEKTLSIVRENKEKSPIFNGQINGVGPRYCPSIEDKAFRYLDRNVHHVFIEPEGLTTDSIYPNGLSTSLPPEIQLNFLRTIVGLEKVEILVEGHAVEYDVVDTLMLNSQLEYADIAGLYFAGQVNGTSGYEEAAAQGLIAGINAAKSFLGKQPLVIDRADSYIGVLIEDLVTSQRDEPYRLFTARSENRLYIREDNTVLRMRPYRLALGLNLKIDQFQANFLYEYSILEKLCRSTTYRPNLANQDYFSKLGYGKLEAQTTLLDLIRRSHLDPVKILSDECDYFQAEFSFDVIKCVAVTLKYEGYVKRAKLENLKFNKYAKLKVDYQKICDSKNISFECKQRIEKYRPSTFLQLQKIEGIRPATLAYVVGNLI